MRDKLGFLSSALLLLAAGSALAADAPAAADCTTVPPIDPNGTFISNFAGNPCYAIALGAGGVGDGFGGDLNAQYDVIYYRVNPGFELIFLGTYPNARYMAVAAYDKHEAAIGSISDQEIVPLSRDFVNPFQKGVRYRGRQKWAATVSFGGTQPATVTPGCSIDGFNIHNNLIDASQIHSGQSWNGDPAAASLPPHITGPNSAGAVLVRRYYNIGAASRAVVVVRDLSTGCAVTASDALTKYRILTTDRTTYVGRWRDQAQWQAHYNYSTLIQPRYCYGVDPTQDPVWLRGPEWLPGGNTNALYIAAQLPPNLIVSPLSRFIRVRLKLPKYPSIPCTDGTCTLTGDEQMRYTSISLQNSGSTLSSVADRDMVADSMGYVTLLYGIGAPRPAFATAANGYTWIDLTTAPNYTSLSAINMRAILPNNAFACQAQVIPNRWAAWTPLGGLIADYAPVVDFPTARELTVPAAPFILPEGSCGVFPATPPSDCRIFYPPPAPAL